MGQGYWSLGRPSSLVDALSHRVPAADLEPGFGPAHQLVTLQPVDGAGRDLGSLPKEALAGTSFGHDAISPYRHDPHRKGLAVGAGQGPTRGVGGSAQLGLDRVPSALIGRANLPGPGQVAE